MKTDEQAMVSSRDDTTTACTWACRGYFGHMLQGRQVDAAAGQHREDDVGREDLVEDTEGGGAVDGSDQNIEREARRGEDGQAGKVPNHTLAEPFAVASGFALQGRAIVHCLCHAQRLYCALTRKAIPCVAFSVW